MPRLCCWNVLELDWAEWMQWMSCWIHCGGHWQILLRSLLGSNVHQHNRPICMCVVFQLQCPGGHHTHVQLHLSSLLCLRCWLRWPSHVRYFRLHVCCMWSRVFQYRRCQSMCKMFGWKILQRHGSLFLHIMPCWFLQQRRKFAGVQRLWCWHVRECNWAEHLLWMSNRNVRECHKCDHVLKLHCWNIHHHQLVECVCELSGVQRHSRECFHKLLVQRANTVRVQAGVWGLVHVPSSKFHLHSMCGWILQRGQLWPMQEVFGRHIHQRNRPNHMHTMCNWNVLESRRRN